MKKLTFPMMVEEIHIFVPGDPSVGIFNHNFTINNFGYEVQDNDDLMYLRLKLLDTFSDIFGEKVGVATKQEIDLMEEAIAELHSDECE